MRQIEKLNNSIVPVAEGAARVVILATLRIRPFTIKRQKLRCCTQGEELSSGPCVPKHTHDIPGSQVAATVSRLSGSAVYLYVMLEELSQAITRCDDES